ncbi:MAG: TonB-dependent receptor [Bacteroidales bacterium]|nr:TonB-dependent receptor [Bacteroidales bacterium]
MRKNLILGVSALFFNLALMAQPLRPAEAPSEIPGPGSIRGIIHDSTTQGNIEYATVGLYRMADSTLVNGVVTGPDGAFIFRDVLPGTYYVDANFIGYEQKRISTLVIASQRTALDLGVVVMHPDITQIGEVHVVAQSQRVEYKIDKKVVNVAQDISSAGGSLVNVLENTPSVEVDVEGNVSLRGSSNFQLLIDGKPSIIGGSEGLQQIPASAVQSIEIITSPSAKYDPDGAAGIINVVMKKQRNNGVGGIINASVGTKNKYSTDFLLNFKHQKLNYFIGGEYADQHNYNTGENERRTYLGDTTTTIRATNEGEFSRKSLNLKMGFDYALSDKSVLSLSGAIGNREFRRDFNSLGSWFTAPASKDSFFLEESNSRDKDAYYNLNLDYQKRYDDKGHELQASVYYANSGEEEAEEDIVRKTDGSFHLVGTEPKRTRARTETPEQELRIELDYTRPVSFGKIEAGLQSRLDKDRGTYIYEDYLSGSEWLQDDSISNTLEYRDLLESGYLIVSGPLGKFEYQTGIRAEYDNRTLEQKTSSQSFTYEKFHFFPSFYLTRKLSEAHQLQFTYSRRIQRPNERNLNPFIEFRGADNVFFGNPALRPEFTNAFELNYQYTFKKGFISLETYYRGTYDKITQLNGYDTIAGRPVFTFTTINASKDYSLGMELMTNLELTKWWQLNLTGNLFHYQLNGMVDNREVTSRSMTWRTNFNSSFKLKWDTRLQISGFYNGPSRTLQGSREGFFVANVALRKEMLKKKLTLSLNARDILSTGVFSFTSEGNDFYTHNTGRRESPVVMLNLTFRINNYRQAANRSDGNGDSDMNGMDDMM